MKRLCILLFISFLLTNLWAQSDYMFRKLDFCSDKNNEFGGMVNNGWFVYSSDYKKNDVNPSGNITIFKTIRDADNNWHSPRVYFDDIVNESNYGPVVLYDSTTAYYTEYKFDPEKLFGGISSKNVAAIHFKKKKKGKWSKSGKSFIYNGIQCFTGHPTFDSENEKMFFSAEFEDSKGGTDIFYCFRDGDDWSEPINIGKKINTAGDELFPFYYDGTLYFSSNMHNPIGGFDIFYSKYESGEWTSPIALGKPINGEHNDFSFSIMEGGNMIFSSDRAGSFDIYSYQTKFPDFERCNEKYEENYCIYVIEEGTGDLDTSLMIYEWDMGDGNVITGNGEEYCYKEQGNFTINLNVIDKLTGIRTNCVASTNIEVKTPRGIFYNVKDTVKINQEFVISGVRNQLGDYNNRILFWNMGDTTELTGDNVRHIYTKPGVYEIVLGVLKNEMNYEESERYCIYKKIVVVE